MEEDRPTYRDDEPRPRAGSGDPNASRAGRGGMSPGAKAAMGILAAIAVVLLIVVIVLAVDDGSDDGGTDDPAQTTIEPDVTVEPPEEAPSGPEGE